MIRTKRQAERLKQRLATLADAIEANIMAVDRGGCAVLTATVGQRLAQLGVSVKGTAYTNWSGTLDSDSFSHVALRLELPDQGPCLWDNAGLRPHEEEWTVAKLVGDLPIERVAESAADPYVWNRRFDRAQIPKIERLVNRYLPLPRKRGAR